MSASVLELDDDDDEILDVTSRLRRDGRGRQRKRLLSRTSMKTTTRKLQRGWSTSRAPACAPPPSPVTTTTRTTRTTSPPRHVTDDRGHPQGARQREAGARTGAQGSPDGTAARPHLGGGPRAGLRPDFRGNQHQDGRPRRHPPPLGHRAPEGGRRRYADRLLKRERSRGIDEEEQRDYREDQPRIVRPRRSEPCEGEKAVSSSIRGPLLLGLAQRIDAPADNPPRCRPPAPPRRPTTSLLMKNTGRRSTKRTTAPSSPSPKAWARGTSPIEAAAAAFVERQPSAPLHMRRAAAIETDEEFTREAGRPPSASPPWQDPQARPVHGVREHPLPPRNQVSDSDQIAGAGSLPRLSRIRSSSRACGGASGSACPMLNMALEPAPR